MPHPYETPLKHLCSNAGGLCSCVAHLRGELCRKFLSPPNALPPHSLHCIPQGAILGSCTFLYLTDRLGYGLVRRVLVVSQGSNLLTSVYSSGCCSGYALVSGKIGRAQLTPSTASLMMMVAYALQAAAVPFPVFVVAYFFIGFGNSFLVRCHTTSSNFPTTVALIVVAELRLECFSRERIRGEGLDKVRDPAWHIWYVPRLPPCTVLQSH